MQLEHLSAARLGSLVNEKVISPTEVMEYFLNHVKRRNDRTNAFVYLEEDKAMDAARHAEIEIMNGKYLGPFAGVPVALKEFLPEKKGWLSWHGGVECYQTEDSVTGVVCRAFEQLGAIPIGKTNAPSFGFRGTTDNKMFGPTSTPFRPGFNSGGSSGGSAAAVGDGLVPMASAGDAGGSIRIPAAWCGCFGFKSSAGVVPSICRPDAWTATHPYCCPGPITRTVEDAAIVVDKMCKYNPRDPLSIPNAFINAQHYTQYHAQHCRINRFDNLRVAYTVNFNLFPKPVEDVIASMVEVIEMLKGSISKLDKVCFTFHHSREEIERSWLQSISIDDALNDHVSRLIEKHPEDFPDEFLYWNKVAKDATLQDYRKFHEIRTDILDAHQAIFDDYDIILAPVTGCLPVQNATDNNTKGPREINGEPVDDLIGFAYTYLENMIGTPAASIPIGISKEGFPIGLQVIANRYCDNKVFEFCAALEKLKPWYSSYSKIWA